MTKASVTRHEDCEVYHVRKPFGWGVIVINESSGLFMAYTDFGSFSHHWPAPGDAGLKHFLTDMDYSYAMGKFRGSDYGRIFNAGKAVADLKEVIREQQEEGNCTAQEADDAIEQLSVLEDECSFSKERFMYFIRDNNTILDAIGHDEWWYAVDGMVNDPQCVGFWNEILIPFVESYCPEHKLKRVES